MPLDLRKSTKISSFVPNKWPCYISLLYKNARLSDHIIHEGNRHYETGADKETLVGGEGGLET